MHDWTDWTAANMTTPKQLMELPHPQSHDHVSTSGGAQANCERFIDDDELAALSKGVVSASMDMCVRWASNNLVLG